MGICVLSAVMLVIFLLVGLVSMRGAGSPSAGLAPRTEDTGDPSAGSALQVEEADAGCATTDYRAGCVYVIECIWCARSDGGGRCASWNTTQRAGEKCPKVVG